MREHRFISSLQQASCHQNLTSNYAQAVLANSPVGYWQMQECSGDLLDSSGGGFTMQRIIGLQIYHQTSTPLTATDTYSIESAGGTIYQTNAVGVPTTAVNNCSMELWIKLVTPYVTQDQQLILYNGSSGTNGWGLMLGTNRQLQLLRGGIASSGASTAIVDDVWTHIVMVRDSGTWKLYLQGALDSGAGFGSGAPNTPTVGAFTSGGAVQRQTCHMAIYATALSSTQVSNHYAAR
jgi:hypothetical protein